MELTKNFTLEELCRSYTATRMGIKNVPTKKQIDNLKYLCLRILQPCREKFGRINVSSGYRGKELNDEIGSTDRSYHLKAKAADLEADNEKVSNLELLVWIYENCEFTELIAENFDIEDNKAGWVHVAIDRGNEARVVKLKDKNHKYSVVDIEYIKSLYS